jgi:hypothetical protein
MDKNSRPFDGIDGEEFRHVKACNKQLAATALCNILDPWK